MMFDANWIDFVSRWDRSLWVKSSSSKGVDVSLHSGRKIENLSDFLGKKLEFFFHSTFKLGHVRVT